MRRVVFALPLLALLLVATVTADNVTVSATVQGYLTATFNYNTVSFGELTAGTTDSPAPNQADGVYNVTIDANGEFEVEAYGSDFSDGVHTLAINNLKMDTDTDPANLNVNNAVALSTSVQTIDTNIPYTTTTHYHGFWLSIPSNQPAGTYTTTVTITYSLV